MFWFILFIIAAGAAFYYRKSRDFIEQDFKQLLADFGNAISYSKEKDVRFREAVNRLGYAHDILASLTNVELMDKLRQPQYAQQGGDLIGIADEFVEILADDPGVEKVGTLLTSTIPTLENLGFSSTPETDAPGYTPDPDDLGGLINKMLADLAGIELDPETGATPGCDCPSCTSRREDAADLKTIADRRGEETIPWEQAKANVAPTLVYPVDVRNGN